jgi:hypothetical protein
MNVVYVRFDKSLDYKEVVNSLPIKKFLESAFGEFPKMISPTKFTFDRDKLGEYIQDQFEKSKSYILDWENIPPHILESYCSATGKERKKWDEIQLVDFEPEILLDDHIVVVYGYMKVLGVFATEDDFEKIVNEVNILNVGNKMDVGDQKQFDQFCEYANEHIEEFL